MKLTIRPVVRKPALPFVCL